MSLLKQYKEMRAKIEKPGRREINDYLFYRPLAAWVMLLIKDIDTSPNVISSLSVVAVGIAGYFFWDVSSYANIIWAVVWINIGMILDTVDGSYSRYKGIPSEFGRWYDSLCDVFKLLIIINTLTIGFYFNGDITSQIWFNQQPLFVQHREIILILGLLTLSQFFLVFYVHASRRNLTFNKNQIVSREYQGLQIYIGMETSIYVLFTILLLTSQIYLFFFFWIFVLPMLWILPWYGLYRNNKLQNNPSKA